ncbi:hypothetical protein J1605_001282 [Eschrichtius robustus]|uniref:Uncharacterized protein n=1 Tax=Eschrichtius robustus TaxID=9764 RepID=A0AB34G6U5_ESCRO|nr:hypothetical protein J1605_001282 [Eschrichtius robustus]
MKLFASPPGSSLSHSWSSASHSARAQSRCQVHGPATLELDFFTCTPPPYWSGDTQGKTPFSLKVVVEKGEAERGNMPGNSRIFQSPVTRDHTGTTAAPCALRSGCAITSYLSRSQTISTDGEQDVSALRVDPEARQDPLCFCIIKERSNRASLVAQWLRICLPMQGTRVRALVWEDPTCRGATGPVSHNY